MLKISKYYLIVTKYKYLIYKQLKMIASIFKDTICVWVDYSNREDCIKVIDITEEQKQLLEKWYSYNIETWEFEETPESIEFKKQLIENKKKEILKQLWELKQIKDWLELVWEDITEIDLKINELKTEYKSL